LPFSAAIALCPLEAPGRSSCREKNTPTPQLSNILKKVFKANIKLKYLKYILFAFLLDL
jgi:hypothetical protein